MRGSRRAARHERVPATTVTVGQMGARRLRRARALSLWVPLGVLALGACVARPRSAPEASGWREAVGDTVRALFEACVAEEVKGNPEVCLGQMSRDPDFRYFVNTTLSTDADSIAERTRRGFANRLRWEMEVDVDTVAVLGPEAAALTATLRVTTQDVGGPVLTCPASWSLVYARRGDAWAIVQGHWTYGEPAEAGDGG